MELEQMHSKLSGQYLLINIVYVTNIICTPTNIINVLKTAHFQRRSRVEGSEFVQIQRCCEQRQLLFSLSGSCMVVWWHGCMVVR